MDAQDLDFQRGRIGLGVDSSVEKSQIGESTGEEASFKTLFGDQDGDEELGFILSSTRIVEELDTKSS